MKGEPVEPEREVRIDLPVKAFIPPEWVGQEALRLDLYRRISTAKDGAELAAVRAEAGDRFGPLPPPVRTLLAAASLRLSCLARGVEEVSTFRRQIRIKPVDESWGHEAAARTPEASYHPATRTLNLDPPAYLGGEALPQWVEEVLEAGAGPAEEVGGAAALAGGAADIS
jgi:transcription-repair coupling factor (superfamily II helicase)